MIKPTFSWERPIEQEILRFAEAMKNQWNITTNHGDREIALQAKGNVMAYETMIKHIKDEIAIRSLASEIVDEPSDFVSKGL